MYPQRYVLFLCHLPQAILNYVFKNKPIWRIIVVDRDGSYYQLMSGGGRIWYVKEISI